MATVNIGPSEKLNKIAHTIKFGERIFATPAVIGDRIYLRTEKALWAFG